MSFSLRPLALLFLSAALAAAQQPAEPGADEVKALQEKFLAEREQALKAKFSAEALARADELADRAAAAAKAQNYRGALRLLRDARWQVPYRPPGLPEHVARVLGESRMRHPDRVTALSYSPDGRFVASGCRDFLVKVWDLGTGREVSTYRGHIDQPDDPTRASSNVLGATDVCFHPKENILASASGNQVHVWDPATGKTLKTLVNLGKTDRPIKSIAYSPDGKLLAVGADDGILRVVESDTGKAVYTSPSRNSRIERVCFSPNGKLVAIGDSNSQVAVYVPEGKGNQPAMSVQVADHGVVAGVAFTADGGAVLTGGADGKARLTAGPGPTGTSAPNTATKLRDYTGHAGPVTGLAVTADGKFLVTAGDDKTVRVWDVGTAKQLRSFQGHLVKATAVAVRGDGRQVVSASEDGAIRAWDLYPTDDHKALTESKDSLWAVAVSPNGKRLATGGADKLIRVYDSETGKLETTLDAGAAMTTLAFLPDSNRLVAGGGDKVVKVWDVGAKKVATELPGHGLAVLAVAVSETGKFVVSGSADATVRGFDPDGGKELWKWPSRKAACGVAVRKGGKQVAVGLADGTLAVLDVSGSAPKEVASLAAHTAGVACVAFGPDGTRLATVGGDGALRVWTVADTGALTQLVKFDGQTAPGAGFSPLSTVAFSPDGRFVAAGGADSVVRVWDVQIKNEVRGLRGHSDWITALTFSPDGRSIASVAAEKDNTLRVFDLPALESTGAARGHAKAVNAVAVSPNGALVATAGTDETIKIWELATGKEVTTLVGNNDTPFAIAFQGNDAVVMGGRRSSGAGQLHFWGTAPPRLNKSVPTGEVYAVVPSPDGTKLGAWVARLPVTGEAKTHVYEIYTTKGDLVLSVPDKGREVVAATFAPDLKWAIAGDKSGTARVWDLETKERVGGDWPLFQRSFADLGVTPDRKYLIAADDEGTIKVAEIAQRNTVVSGKAHAAGVRAVVVSPTGTTFLTISNDRELKVWSLTDLKELKELRSWAVPVTVIGAVYAPDGRSVVTANADGTAYVLELP